MHRRNSIVRTKKKSDYFVRQVRVFKFKHRAKRKTRTWKTRTIWSEKSEMSETSEVSTWPKQLLFIGQSLQNLVAYNPAYSIYIYWNNFEIMKIFVALANM